jgi:uncharacterized protein
MTEKFVGRTRELRMLDDLHARSRGGQMFVLYGRRRVGKTELLNHWIETRGHAHIYWTADRISNASLLRSFSQAVFAAANPGIAAAGDFSYASWDQAFGQLGTVARSKRLVVVMDEFTYAIESEPALPSILQRLWDHHLKRSRILLVLTGSHAGMIEREILKYRSPLYGRATNALHLQPLPFRALRSFLPEYSIEDRIIIHGCVGGIPLYLEGLEPDAPLEENLRLLLTRNIMLDDAGALLRDQLSDPRNYAGLVENIAAGFTRLGDIARMTGMEEGAASKYLGVLQRLGIVERMVPATVSRPAQSKLGRYRLLDPYLRFYYRFIWPNRTLIASGRLEQPLAHLRQHLHEFVGRHGFEELCREWVLDRANAGQLGFVPRRVAPFWRSRGSETLGLEIDVMAINEDTKHALIGECKFTREPIGASVVRRLIEDKTPLTGLDASAGWQIRHAFFSRAGFTPEARAAAGRHVCEWVDLARLERELAPA